MSHAHISTWAFRVLALLVACFGAVSPTMAAKPNTPNLLPAGSMGYVHFTVDDLLQTSTLSFPARLVKKVPQELAEFSVSHFGFDLTDLDQVTIILPTFELATANKATNATPFLIAGTFKKPFSRDSLISRLPDGWAARSVDGATYHTNGGSEAIAVVGDRTVLFGSDGTMQWCLGAKNQAQKTAARFQSSADGDYLSAVVNLDAIPGQLLSMVPPQLQPFLQAQSLKVVLDIDQGYALHAELAFAEADEATSAATQLNNFVGLGKQQLSQTEKTFLDASNDTSQSVREGFKSVLNLALVRHVQDHIDLVQVNQTDRNVTLQLETDHDIGQIALVCLTAIHNIGVEANRQFEEITEKLDQ